MVLGGHQGRWIRSSDDFLDGCSCLSFRYFGNFRPPGTWKSSPRAILRRLVDGELRRMIFKRFYKKNAQKVGTQSIPVHYNIHSMICSILSPTHPIPKGWRWGGVVGGALGDGGGVRHRSHEAAPMVYKKRAQVLKLRAPMGGTQC